MFFGLLLTISALLGVASGHMIMITPTPYDTSLQRPDPQTWPLDTASLPFPCQMGGDPVVKSITQVTAGASTLVQFSGSAVHGGGSCQFSINYGDPTSPNSNDWHVIYTIIGGCPASSVGNIETIGEDADQRPLGRQCGNAVDTECVRQFEIPIPKGMRNGNATFAWSWFNKIGNREMYMNCAPIVISGGDADGDAFVKGLPAIFVANIDEQPCETAKSEGAVLNIPNPGAFGEILEEPDSEAIGNCSPDGPVPLPNFGTGSTATSGGLELSIADTSPTALESTGTTPLTTALTSTTVTTPARDNSTSGIVSASSPYEVSSPLSVPLTTSSSLSITASAPYHKPNGWVECDAESGGFLCLNETHFGICNSGYAAPQLVPTDTACDVKHNTIIILE